MSTYGGYSNYYDSSLNNLMDLFKEFFTKYMILGSVILILHIAAIVLGIIAGISMVKDEEKAAGITTLVLAILGIFVPVCGMIALIIAGVMALKDGAKGFGTGCIGVAAGQVIMTVVVIAMYINLVMSGVGSATVPAASFHKVNMQNMLGFDIKQEQPLTVEVEMKKAPVDVEFFDPSSKLQEVYADEDAYNFSMNGGWNHAVNTDATHKTYHLDDCKAGTWTLRFSGQDPVSIEVTGANGVPATWTPDGVTTGTSSGLGSGE